MIFIVGMIVIRGQVEYIQHKNIGYEKSNLIYLPLAGKIASTYKVFKHEALQVPGITSITMMSQRPVELENATSDVVWEGKAPDAKPNFTQVAVGYDFIQTMEAGLLYGRDLSEEHADSASYMINETAMRVIGYKDPVGMPLSLEGVNGTIIGVVRDFHFNSLHVPIEPMVLRLKRRANNGYALIRIAPGKMDVALSGLEALHKKMNPEFVFAHQFADEEYNYSYQREQVIDKLSRWLALLAITISSLGLLGLVMFTSEQRTKEIGIRKVMGATVPQIVGLLSTDFLKLVILSSVLASPVAYYFMNQWLSGFVYHTGIQWWVFVVATLGALCIALLTVSFQAIKAAVANPVKSLKVE
jgi:hypothetical protein